MNNRTLKSGRSVPEQDNTVALTIETRCPAKWAALDMETGEVWMADATGRWKRASEDLMQEVKSAVGSNPALA